MNHNHAMMYPNRPSSQYICSEFFVTQKSNTIVIFLMGFLHGVSGRIGFTRCVGLDGLPLIPVEKPFFITQKGRPKMLQQVNGHVLPQNYQIEKEQIFLGQKNFQIMGQVRVIFFEDANGELQAMIKFDQHSPELLKREGLVFAHFALAEMVEREELLVTV